MGTKKVVVEQNIPMLHQAEELINGERQKDYGDKLPNFSQIAAFWNAHLKFKLMLGHFISAEDVALMMINVKQARLVKSPEHYDSILDVAGYAGCYDRIREERKAMYGGGVSGAAMCGESIEQMTANKDYARQHINPQSNPNRNR